MFIAKNNDLIILAKETREELEFALQIMNYTSIEETDINYIFYNGQYITEEEFALQEKERIQELFMTRSDFFDGTIQAWRVGQDELLVLVQGLLTTLPIEDVKKLMAVNNFKNALNFYRKHDLFKMLVNMPIPLGDNIQVIITDEHLDKFFDEVNKGNKATAWQYLPQPVMLPVEEETNETESDTTDEPNDVSV